MTFLAFLVLSQSDPASVYAAQAQGALLAADKQLKPFAAAIPPAPATAVVEIEVGADGAAQSVRLGASSGANKVDDVARAWVLAAEPLPAPDPALMGERASVSCVLRLTLSKKKRDAQAMCFAGDDPVPHGAPAAAAQASATDAGALLFAGWASERGGDAAAAQEAYKKAIAAAPAWDLAARALGLALVKDKKGAAAIPYLKTYVTTRLAARDALSYAREIERYEAEQKKKAEELTRPRPRLGKEDLMVGIRKGYALLEPCLAKARTAGLLAVGVDTLLVTWKVRKDGGVEAAELEAPQKLLLTEHAECLQRAVTAWRFPPYTEGSEIFARNVPIKVRGAAPPADSGNTVAASTEAFEEASFSTCERGSDELAGFLKERTPRVLACITAEKRRNGASGWPDSVPVSFVIDAQGPVRNIEIGHRFFREGPVAACMTQALTANLAPSGGADCPAEFDVDLRGLQALR